MSATAVKTYKSIGLMSGTSLDGLDIAYCELTFGNNSWGFKILHAETIAYDSAWQKKLNSLHEASTTTLIEAHMAYGKYLGELVNTFMNSYNIIPDLICSHGHTIFHQPEKGFTFQLGNGQAIALQTGITTVSDFRTKDVLLGGQGAPLVPIGDELLFADYGSCLNLGGFSNISFKKENKRIAFDICPVNMALNSLSRELGHEFDEDGKIAASGAVDSQLLSALNGIGFYHCEGPRSLGREWYENNFRPLLCQSPVKTIDKLRTLTEHIALMVSRTINTSRGKCLATGGGAFNKFLMERIKYHSDNQIIIPDPRIVSFKEAMVFALLGVLRFRNEVNCLSSVTGASEDSSSGTIYRP